jgi:hypothetical protein
LNDQWDSDPNSRPRVTEIKELISLLIGAYRDNELKFKYYMKIDKDQQHYEIEKKNTEYHVFISFLNGILNTRTYTFIPINYYPKDAGKIINNFYVLKNNLAICINLICKRKKQFR